MSFLVNFLGITSNHIPLKYRCPNKKSNLSKCLICSTDCKWLTKCLIILHFLIILTLLSWCRYGSDFLLKWGYPRPFCLLIAQLLMCSCCLLLSTGCTSISAIHALHIFFFVYTFFWFGIPWRPFWHLLPPWGMFLTDMICCVFRGALFVCRISHGGHGLWLPLEPHSSHSCRSVWSSSLCNPLQN